MRRTAQRVTPNPEIHIGIRDQRRFLQALGGKPRVLLAVSHLHGFVAGETLLTPEIWQHHNTEAEVVGVFTDDPVHRAVQCKVDRRSWRHYRGEELRYFANLVPRLAEAHNIPICYDSTNTDAARRFVAGLRNPPNVIVCCCYHAWIPRWMRQLCGERSGFGGRCFNIHPNDANFDMHRMAGTAPFEAVLTGPDKGMRMSLLRLVGSRWDDPDYVLQSTRMLDWPAGLKAKPERARFQLAYQLTACLVRELLSTHLVSELLTQLCAETKVRLGGHVPSCPAPLYV